MIILIDAAAATFTVIILVVWNWKNDYQPDTPFWLLSWVLSFIIALIISVLMGNLP